LTGDPSTDEVLSGMESMQRALRARLVGAAAFSSVYAFSVCVLERRSERKHWWQHVAASTLAGVSTAVGGGHLRAGLMVGSLLGAATAPLYHYAFVTCNLPTLNEMFKATEPPNPAGDMQVAIGEPDRAAAVEASLEPETPAREARQPVTG
jgi:hypothetical protein